MMSDQSSSPLLAVENLRTVFHFADGAYPAIDSLSFELRAGEVLGLVGESGSGKSVAGFSLIGLVDAPGEIVSGEVRFKGRDLRKLSDEELRRVRGKSVSMIFQDPLTTLNPVLTIGEQMMEAISEHETVDPAAARQRCIDTLTKVGITSPQTRVDQYPHELSGGMRQRVAIATALLNQPELIIADEPTTALDVTIQGQILAEMQTLQKETGTALIWITHDLGVVSELADRIAVMYAGGIVEIGQVDDVLDTPRHPYTLGLLNSVPGDTPRGEALRQIEGAAPSLTARPLGCPFHPRCFRASDLCRTEEPPLAQAGDHSWRCHHPLDPEKTP
ncbi:ABC transporter ATP-binding protein [Nitratireductor aquimarinus]|uniref:ABC transporter ATP-binding protein n=1 Tax=Nitratireductor aquimarinus TaxID=889300 RepID=UPI001A8E7EAB|nr:ABC transporter ATP-binding protein [Nitratireductor aquimarinus]MBN8243803.1 ABC transporter ATP-binding protein [Nitratireductor aquimarinus]MBY6131337.1 ABC transporter ATP-binding protein [Nitratireductor aquimarinus]MCA1300869.1 ABC transporter ATP-binding protein [Nitratireductor aquimarinus]